MEHAFAEVFAGEIEQTILHINDLDAKNIISSCRNLVSMYERDENLNLLAMEAIVAFVQEMELTPGEEKRHFYSDKYLSHLDSKNEEYLAWAAPMLKRSCLNMLEQLKKGKVVYQDKNEL